jgi:hypothetical protein
MRARLLRSVHGCVAIAVVALYALLLQSFFTAATPAAPSNLAGILCSHEGADAPAGDMPIRHDHQCCTAVHIGQLAPPPVVSHTVRLDTHAWVVVWRPEAAIRKTGPPTHAHSPRGPPLA